MTEIPKCPTCGRRPSERSGFELRPQFGNSGYQGDAPFAVPCPDSCHDLADLGSAAVAAIEQVTAERDEARALVMELFRRDCLVVDKDASASRSVYDHMASSTYQEAQSALISWGLVKREGCVRD